MKKQELEQIYTELAMKPSDVIRHLKGAGMDVPDHFLTEMVRHKNGKKKISKPWEAFYRALPINLNNWPKSTSSDCCGCCESLLIIFFVS